MPINFKYITISKMLKHKKTLVLKARKLENHNIPTLLEAKVTSKKYTINS